MSERFDDLHKAFSRTLDDLADEVWPMMERSEILGQMEFVSERGVIRVSFEPADQSVSA